MPADQPTIPIIHQNKFAQQTIAFPKNYMQLHPTVDTKFDQIREEINKQQWCRILDYIDSSLPSTHKIQLTSPTTDIAPHPGFNMSTDITMGIQLPWLQQPIIFNTLWVQILVLAIPIILMKKEKYKKIIEAKLIRRTVSEY